MFVRSVFGKILLWCLGTLLFSLVALIAISLFLSDPDLISGGPFRNIGSYLVVNAIDSWEKGGRPALTQELRRQEKFFPMELSLTDGRGIDLLTGRDFSSYIKQPSQPFLNGSEGRFIVVTPGSGNRYFLIGSVNPPPIAFRITVPYYLLTLVALSFLCWRLAVNIASPLRKLSRVVDRFGAGDLDARSELNRRDEIGDLARKFDLMATRMQAMVESERRLLQDVSHELRSPLARLSFAAELALTAVDRRVPVRHLRREIACLTGLVDSLLHLTRAEGGFDDRHLEPVSLDKLCNRIIEACQLEAAAKECTLEFHGEGPVFVLGDEELLRRAGENVISNAIRYAPQRSQVEIVLALVDFDAVVTVRDHGPGVPEECLERIFTPFFRVDPSREAATGGVGLGLSIARRAIALHHGKIFARNRQPGLQITFVLPVAASLPKHEEPAHATT